MHASDSEGCLSRHVALAHPRPLRQHDRSPIRHPDSQRALKFVSCGKIFLKETPGRFPMLFFLLGYRSLDATLCLPQKCLVVSDNNADPLNGLRIQRLTDVAERVLLKMLGGPSLPK